MCQDLLINGLEEPQGVHSESKCHIWYHMTDLRVLIDRNSYSVMQRSRWSMRCGMGILNLGQIINGLQQ